MTQTTQLRPIFFLILFAWAWYLLTLAPSILYFDSPEFVNTAYTLGISHPAGFPLYNMLTKSFTLAPLGSIPFRVNLFSAVMSLVALGLLSGAGVALLKILYPDRRPGIMVWSMLVPLGFLAFSKPYWLQSVQAEVYTLHVAFTSGLILLMFLWKLRDDVRFLYGAGLLFGLSAGNHATVAFYLPAILVLFFCWCRQKRWMHLARCVCLFLLGVSIYAYLPLRSFSEPSFDFGNPETVDGFFYQVTDRRHTDFHFRVFNTGESGKALKEGPSLIEQASDAVKGFVFRAKRMAKLLYSDLTEKLAWTCFIGLLVGGFLCYQRSRPVFAFLMVILGGNVAFFYDWGRESLLPTYAVACLLTAVMLAHFLDAPWSSAPVSEDSSEGDPDEGPGAFRWKPIAWALLVLLIPFTTIMNLKVVNLSNVYSGEGLLKRLYLKLENHSLFLPGMSWFNYYYIQDIERLRDDVTAVPAWDLLSGNPPGMLTQRRYPDLEFPDPAKYDFKSMQNIEAYNREFFELNKNNRPVLLEHNPVYFKQTRLASDFIPDNTLFVKYAPAEMDSEDHSGVLAWQDFSHLLNREATRSREEENPWQGVQGTDWGQIPKMMLMGATSYAHDTERYELEAEALNMQFNTFGLESAGLGLQWLENRLNLDKQDEALATLKTLEEKFSEAYETRLARGKIARLEGRHQQAVSHFLQAVEKQPSALRPYLQLADLYNRMGETVRTQKAMESAQKRITTLRQLAQYEKRALEIKNRPSGALPE